MPSMIKSSMFIEGAIIVPGEPQAPGLAAREFAEALYSEFQPENPLTQHSATAVELHPVEPAELQGARQVLRDLRVLHGQTEELQWYASNHHWPDDISAVTTDHLRQFLAYLRETPHRFNSTCPRPMKPINSTTVQKYYRAVSSLRSRPIGQLKDGGLSTEFGNRSCFARQ